MGQKELTIHGKRLTHRLAGKGPLVLLIRGMAGGGIAMQFCAPVR